MSTPPVIQVDFPPVFSYEHLSRLLGRSVLSLQQDRCRKPHTVPPACTPPGTRQPLWLLTDVLAWLAGHRQATTPPPPRKPGRPTKAEEVAARRASDKVPA